MALGRCGARNRLLSDFFREAQRGILQNYHDVTKNPDFLLWSHQDFVTHSRTLFLHVCQNFWSSGISKTSWYIAFFPEIVYKIAKREDNLKKMLGDKPLEVSRLRLGWNKAFKRERAKSKKKIDGGRLEVAQKRMNGMGMGSINEPRPPHHHLYSNNCNWYIVIT